MIQMKDGQLLQVFVKKSEPDGSISLDRYGSFENVEGLTKWLDRFTLDLSKFKRTPEKGRMSLVKAEKDGEAQYDLYIRLFEESQDKDFLNAFEKW